MKTNHKMIELIIHGFDSDLITNLNENQIDVLHNKLKKNLSKKENKEQVTTVPPKTPVMNVGPKGGKLTIAGKTVQVSPDPKNPGSMNFQEVAEDSGQENSEKNGLTFEVFEEDGNALDQLAGILPDEGNTHGNVGGPSQSIFESNLEEKSSSKQQQKFMGLALSVKKGKTPKSKVSKEVKKVANSMSEKDLKDFASTKHKGLPDKIETKESYMDSLKFSVARNMKNQIFSPNSKLGPSVSFGEGLEEELSKIIEKHIPAKMTKKDLLSLLENWEEDDDVIVKPKRPTTKPNPTIDPDDPYQPAPDVEPAPRANKDELPQWFSFDELGIEFKK